MLVWVAFPCTGGSAWQMLNWRKGSDQTRDNIRHLWRQLRAMWKAFRSIVLPRIDGKSVCVAFEWPAACAYWRWSASTCSLDGARVPPIHETLDRLLPFTALVHGCEHELLAECGPLKGAPVRKLWRVDTDCRSIVDALHRDKSIPLRDRQLKWYTYRCVHDRTVKHAQCAGRVTRMTQHYPTAFSRVVHEAWKRHCDDMERGDAPYAFSAVRGVVFAGDQTVKRSGIPWPFWLSRIRPSTPR